MRSPGQLLALGIALASAPAQTGNSGGASFAGADSEQWAERLRETGAVAGGQLALGLAQDPSSLTVVRALLAHADRTVVEGAIDACRAAGPAASSLRAELLELLVGAPAWWTQERAAHAIAAAGTGDAAVVSALLDHVCRSDVPRMRGECARARDSGRRRARPVARQGARACVR